MTENRTMHASLDERGLAGIRNTLRDWARSIAEHLGLTDADRSVPSLRPIPIPVRSGSTRHPVRLPKRR